MRKKKTKMYEEQRSRGLHYNTLRKGQKSGGLCAENSDKSRVNYIAIYFREEIFGKESQTLLKVSSNINCASYIAIYLETSSGEKK